VGALLAVALPHWAQALSSGGVVFTTITTLLLWNRAVAQRKPGSKRRKSKPKDRDSTLDDSDDGSASDSFQRMEIVKERRTPTPTPTPAPLGDHDKTRS